MVLGMPDDEPRKMEEIRRFSAIYGRFDCKRKPEKPLTLHEVSWNIRLHIYYGIWIRQFDKFIWILFYLKITFCYLFMNMNKAFPIGITIWRIYSICFYAPKTCPRHKISHNLTNSFDLFYAPKTCIPKSWKSCENACGFVKYLNDF